MKRAGAKRTTKLLRVPAHRDVNQRGLKLVETFEGCQLKAYQDEVGIWTVGFGFTGYQHNDGTVHRGLVITQQQANDFLAYNMHQFSARAETFVKVPLSADQFSAIVSFDFNTGGLGQSTLLKLLNKKDYQGAADQLLRWVYAGGKVLRGLVRRRQSERNLFLGKTPYIVETVEAKRGGKPVRWKNSISPIEPPL